MPTSLLSQFHLNKNPFTDRTAERTKLNESALYIRSDLMNYKPNEITYVFFGKRGSGKTTIRLIMQKAYHDYNSQSENPRGHYLVDLCSPGHLTACLSDFQDSIGAKPENWDTMFPQNWTMGDMADCILSYVMTDLVHTIVDSSWSLPLTD